MRASSLLTTLLFAGVVSAQAPILSRLSTGAPDANGITTVRGSAGAVPTNADLALVTLDTGHYATAQAAADGSFSASIFAPPRFLSNLLPLPGTVMPEQHPRVKRRAVR